MGEAEWMNTHDSDEPSSMPSSAPPVGQGNLALQLVGALLPAPPLMGTQPDTSPHGEIVPTGVPRVHVPLPVGELPPDVREPSPRATPLDDLVLWTYDIAAQT